MNKIAWQDEHKELPFLLKLKSQLSANHCGFVVPQDYFNSTADNLDLVTYPELFKVRNTAVFAVPENYFEKAEVSELAKVINDSEEELLSFTNLNALKNKTGFVIPANYFEKNASQLNSNLVKTEGGKIIHLFTKRLAFAAAAILVLSLGFWIFSFYFTTIEVKDCGTMACIDKNDLVKTKNLENLDNDELYELVNPSKLEKKLEAKEIKKENKKTTDSNFKNLSTEDLLDEM